MLWCLRASAGKFNDIFVRDYSVLAESPVKILVLSRFDIFHLMSPEARESLQRSEAGCVRESIESRALKTVAWERYRKKFVDEIIASKRAASGVRADPTASRMTKSTSTPVLPTERTLKQLVEPGCLVMRVHRATHGSHGSATQSTANLELTRSSEANGGNRTLDTASDELHRRRSDSLLDPVGDANDSTSLPDHTAPPEAIPKLSRPHTLTGAALVAPDVVATTKSALQSASDTTELSKPPTSSVEHNSEATSPHGGLLAMGERRRSVAPAHASPNLTKARTLVTLTPLEGSQLPPLQYDKPLHDPSIVSRRANNLHASTRALKLERAADALQAKASSVSMIWSPVHGVCQPFCLLGYMKEQVAPKRTSAASSKARKAPPGSASVSVSRTPDDPPETSVVAFRVFGKFRDLNETLHVFRLVCGAEQVRPPGSTDTSRFAVYKDDEITMVLENFFSEPAADPTASSASPHQFRARDLLHGSGQRFACVGVVLQLPATAVEDAAVHVYQCFPTLQSAARFARQMAAAAAPLYVVPLFEWVPLADLERFDCRSADLEPALEALAAAALCEPLGYRSTWKARKDAGRRAAAAARGRR